MGTGMCRLKTWRSISANRIIADGSSERRRGYGGDFNDGIGELPHGAHEGFHDGGVELSVGAAFEFLEAVGRGAASFVDAITSDGVIRVGHGDDTPTQRNFLT